MDATAGLNRLVVPHYYLIFYPESLSPYPPLSYACAALMPPPAGACSSEHSHDTPTAQCVQWCKPSDQHCARAPHHLPCACPCLRRSHGAAWLFFALPGSWCKCRGCDGCRLRTTTRSLLPPPPPLLGRSASPLKGGGGAGGRGSGGGGGASRGGRSSSITRYSPPIKPRPMPAAAP